MLFGNSIASLAQTSTAPNRGAATVSTILGGPQDQNVLNLGFKYGASAAGNIPTGRAGLLIERVAIGDGQYATMIGPYYNYLKASPAFQWGVNKGTAALDGKLYLDGGTYLSAEAACALGY